MHYKVLKVYNNNVVLAEEPGGKQIVLIGKGVGFGARKGDLINGDDPDNKVFSILDESVNPSEIKRLNYDIEKVEKVTQEIVEIAKWLSAAGAVSGAFFAVFKFLEREKHQQAEIAAIKREQSVMCYGILACLKGLKEQGCNGPVTEALHTLEKHLNQSAHGQEET